jgi:diadenosine tetraphosphate (Ap4A) HIT family hydrolase
VAACVFCGILAGEEPASVVAADERVVAFADILPVGEGHTLVVRVGTRWGCTTSTPRTRRR